MTNAVTGLYSAAGRWVGVILPGLVLTLRVKENFTHGLVGGVNANSRKREAFTLIELLVVIAIIAILAGLLSPGLKKARDQARSISCMNNLRQLGLSFASYRNDFNGKMPHFNCYGNFTWYAQMGPPCPPAPWSPPGLNYISKPVICRCPSNSKLEFLNLAGYESACNFYQNTYSYNAYLSLASESSISRPAQTVVLTDSLYEATGNATSRFSAQYGGWLALTLGSGGCAVGRIHNNAPNMLFFDGHVENVKQARWQTDFDWNNYEGVWP